MTIAISAVSRILFMFSRRFSVRINMGFALIVCFAILGSCQQTLPDFLALSPLPLSPDFGLFSPCELPIGSGLMSGICANASYLNTSLSYCKNYVNYASACVPPSNPLWPSWNASAKDVLIGSAVESFISERLSLENSTLSNISDAGSVTYTPVLLTGNGECVENFKRVSCLVNFPSCDPKTSASFPLCSASCVNYFTSCRFDPAYVASICAAAESIWPFDENLNSRLNLSADMLASEDCTGNSVFHSTAGVSLFPFTFLVLLVSH